MRIQRNFQLQCLWNRMICLGFYFTPNAAMFQTSLLQLLIIKNKSLKSSVCESSLII